MNRTRQCCALVVGLFFVLAAARGQYSFSDQNKVNSISGQFVVSGADSDAPLFRDLNVAANTNLVRLKTALLAVAAERFKISLWEQLGISANAQWSGKISLRLHPARSLDETVTIASTPFLNRWNYDVELPDILSRTRYARALSGVLLLELANRTAQPGGHVAELPDWLVDGLAQQLLASDGDQLVLSAPFKKGDTLAVARINRSERGADPLTGVRQILQNLPVLNFDQLSWPTDEQMEGADGGAYFASAQLFQSELLNLKNGRQKMRNMLAELPGHYNWQTAFLDAFGQDFARPLDVEKWWSLQVVNFAARAPGPRWTTDVSLARMDELLSVPVDFWSHSNSLPTHAEVSLQAVLKNLKPDQRDTVLRAKIRDLSLVELRLAPPFGELADAYRVTLAGFLGDLGNLRRQSVTNKHGVALDQTAVLADTLKKLDALDARRRADEARSLINLTGSLKARTR
jgi:hypothetical protein